MMWLREAAAAVRAAQAAAAAEHTVDFEVENHFHALATLPCIECALWWCAPIPLAAVL